MGSRSFSPPVVQSAEPILQLPPSHPDHEEIESTMASNGDVHKRVLSVPVIDIAALMTPTTDAEVAEKAAAGDAALQKIVDQVRAAATEWGFFYITNHGVSEIEIEELRTSMRAFFALPKDVKNRIRRTIENTRGYFDDELTKNKLDWKEVFDFAGREEDAPPGEGHVQRLKSDQNQWLPEEVLPGFRRSMGDYYERADRIAHRLIMAFSLVLGKGAMFLKQFFSTPDGQKEHSNMLRLNHYPASPDPENTMGVYHHTDAGALTVLLQDDEVASLQIFHRDSKSWVFVPPIKNTYVINIGDMLQIWSNDRFPAPLHRVLSSGTANRFSVPLFYHPSLSATVEPLLQEEGEEPHYRPVSWYEFNLRRTQDNYADLGEEVQITQYRI